MRKLSHIYLKGFVYQQQMRTLDLSHPINALTKGRATSPIDTNLQADEAKVYSITTFTPARKRIIDKVHPAKNSLKC